MNSLPEVDFCGLRLSRLLIGANPFGGYSHQSEARDAAMVAYYTPDRIIETLRLAEDEGITGMVANNETPHVLEAVTRYLRDGGRLQWIAQLNCRHKPDMESAIDEVLEIGARALVFHGARIDDVYASRDEALVRRWFSHAKASGLPVGAGAHDPRAHLWINELGIADFHAVCFFNCGSLHSGKGHMFKLGDIFPATAAIRAIPKPCIAYKVLASGRIDPRLGLEYAYESVKPGDVVNLGMFRGDRDDMVAQNVGLVRSILG